MMPSRLIPKSFFGRSLIILMAPLLIVQIISIFVFSDRHLDSVTKLLAGNIASMTNTLLLLQGSPEISEQNLRKIAHDYFSVQYEFHPQEKIDPTLRLPGTWAESFLIETLNQSLSHPYNLIHDDQYLILKVQLENGIAIIKLLRKRLMSKTTPLVFFWAIGSSVLFLLIAGLFMRNQVRPLQLLAESTEAFGKGRIMPDFKPSGSTEIRQLAIAFNVMRDRIKRQVTQRTEMLAGISHDLRTPLTRMKLGIEMLPQNEFTQELRTDVIDMENMVNEYLTFVRGDSLETPQNINLIPLLQDLCTRTSTPGFTLNNLIEVSCLECTVRPNAFKRCLKNLLANAARYATHATLTAVQNEDYLTLYLDDNGIGIPVEKRQEVFKAFYRIEESRNPATGGIGLGLSIVQDIVHSHGGQIFLEDSPLGGLRVELRFPL
jgi:two-component system osmolarity sensor histidine kinase EnvZ